MKQSHVLFVRNNPENFESKVEIPGYVALLIFPKYSSIVLKNM